MRTRELGTRDYFSSIIDLETSVSIFSLSSYISLLYHPSSQSSAAMPVMPHLTCCLCTTPASAFCLFPCLRWEEERRRVVYAMPTCVMTLFDFFLPSAVWRKSIPLPCISGKVRWWWSPFPSHLHSSKWWEEGFSICFHVLMLLPSNSQCTDSLQWQQQNSPPCMARNLYLS